MGVRERVYVDLSFDSVDRDTIVDDGGQLITFSIIGT